MMKILDQLLSSGLARLANGVFLLFGLTGAGCSSAQPEIVQKPINWDKTREELSLEYMKAHYGIEKEQASIDPKMIVIHWTDIPTMEATYDTFYPSLLPSSREGIKSASSLNVSSQYLIDRDGTIYQLLPDTTFARHVIGLNHCAIGIENVADGERYPLTEAQFEANLALIRYLAGKHAIEYLIGHDQYKRFIGHELWMEKDPNYLTDKDDVGEDFIRRLFARLNMDQLKPAPANHQK